MRVFTTRKRLRLKSHNYLQDGSYFVTICSIQRELIFGEIRVGQGLCSCRLSNIGIIVDHEINELEKRYPTIRIAKYVIMPNHIHMIISLQSQKGAVTERVAAERVAAERVAAGRVTVERQEQSPCPTGVDSGMISGRQEQSPCPTIGDIVCTLKSLTTKRANADENMQGRKIWQYRYYDHVIRNEREYQKIDRYIETNPQKWNEDYFYIKA